MGAQCIPSYGGKWTLHSCSFGREVDARAVYFMAGFGCHV